MVFPFSVDQSWAKVYATPYNISPLPNGCREVTFLFWDDNGTPLDHSDDKKLGFHFFIHCPDKKSGSAYPSNIYENTLNESEAIHSTFSDVDDFDCKNPIINYLSGRGLLINSNDGEWKIDIMDMAGRTLYSGKKVSGSDQIIQVHRKVASESGIIIVRLHSDKCQQVISRKIYIH